jgi:hypothetical protein
MSLIPQKLPLKNEIIHLTEPSLRLIGLAPDGTLYASASAYELKKSTDWGQTWTFVYKGTAPFQRVEVLNDGSIIAIQNNSIVRRSTDNGATFSEVLDASATGNVSSWGGIDFYDNFGFIIPYDNTTTNKIYMTSDYGATWREILEIPISDDFMHCHDVRYDPYEAIIWSVWGDGAPRVRILFSDDHGETWQKSDNSDFYRCTNIMPLPNSVWFGTDERYTTGTYRFDRPAEGTSQTKVKPYLNWAAKKNNRDAAPVTWATKPAMVYGREGCAYWGYIQGTGGQRSLPSQIYKTDGERVITVWSQDIMPTTGPVRILSVFGPDNDGDIAASLVSDYDVDGTIITNHIVKVSTI